ncbi:MAG: exodeoxyribonuclease VII large subunit [Puniceicoccales bacterium]|jgi:exodeoxyribonuclease VII large subunit|nr:exodeoxyribonuclease VII large subunit [Puniceicoccales bacterium]
MPSFRPSVESLETFSVSEFTRQLKGIVETAFPSVWIRGEISNLRRQTSGHIYFTLKDAQSQLAAVLFRGDALKVECDLRDGLQIRAFGAVSIYEPRGNYQLVVRLVEEDGLGRLQRAFEALKQKLAQEGLFDRALKRQLPLLPQVVGVITSPTGAAIQDFVQILQRRGWKGRVIILPVRVQGSEAAGEITTALEHANTLGGFDLLVVARGGGSLEDLWPFNEEAVVRAIRASAIPVVSAVGHEIDFTLSDFTADVRAETPSAAAELISSSYLNCVERVERAERDLRTLVQRYLETLSQRLDLASIRLEHHKPEKMLERLRLHLASLENRFHAAPKFILARQREKLSDLEIRLRKHSPEERLKVLQGRLDVLGMRMNQAVVQAQGRWTKRLAILETRLKAASIEETLKRGFALVRDDTGKVVRSVAAVEKGKRMRVQFADGEAGVVGE